MDGDAERSRGLRSREKKVRAEMERRRLSAYRVRAAAAMKIQKWYKKQEAIRAYRRSETDSDLESVYSSQTQSSSYCSPGRWSRESSVTEATRYPIDLQQKRKGGFFKKREEQEHQDREEEEEIEEEEEDNNISFEMICKMDKISEQHPPRIFNTPENDNGNSPEHNCMSPEQEATTLCNPLTRSINQTGTSTDTSPATAKDITSDGDGRDEIHNRNRGTWSPRVQVLANSSSNYSTSQFSDQTSPGKKHNSDVETTGKELNVRDKWLLSAGIPLSGQASATSVISSESSTEISIASSTLSVSEDDWTEDSTTPSREDTRASCNVQSTHQHFDTIEFATPVRMKVETSHEPRVFPYQKEDLYTESVKRKRGGLREIIDGTIEDRRGVTFAPVQDNSSHQLHTMYNPKLSVLKQAVTCRHMNPANARSVNGYAAQFQHRLQTRPLQVGGVGNPAVQSLNGASTYLGVYNKMRNRLAGVNWPHVHAPKQSTIRPPGVRYLAPNPPDVRYLPSLPPRSHNGYLQRFMKTDNNRNQRFGWGNPVSNQLECTVEELEAMFSPFHGNQSHQPCLSYQAPHIPAISVAPKLYSPPTYTRNQPTYSSLHHHQHQQQMQCVFRSQKKFGSLHYI